MSTAAVSGNQGSMNPFELVLSKLPDARPVAGSSHKAWKARCPAHADSDPSLSVTLGDQGGALIHCYAGCSPEAVVGALGLTMADLMPPRETQRGHSTFPACPNHPPEKANAPVEKAECPLCVSAGSCPGGSDKHQLVDGLVNTRGPSTSSEDSACRCHAGLDSDSLHSSSPPRNPAASFP